MLKYPYRKIPFVFFASLLLCGCSAYRVKSTCQREQHPANSSVSIIPIKMSQTLEIKEEGLPKKPEKEPEMHHMHHGGE